MYAVADWLCSNGFRVREYLSEKEAECSPNLVWWIFLFALHELAREANAVFVSLQDMTTLVKQQDDRFGGLVQRLLNISGALGPLEEAAILELDSGKYEIIGSFAISQAAPATYLNNLNLWVCEGLKTLAEGQQTFVVNAVARMYLLAISNIFALKERAHTSPRVTPKELATSSMVELVSLIDTHRERILRTFGDEGIDKIGQEFKRLRVEYIDGKPIRKAIDSFDHRLASFDQMWQLDDAERFPTLASLCGGFASVFPNTATVEDDFSLIGCEKTNRRRQLLSPLAS
ncbi:hypothetical protein PHYSODRAFT_467933 [Phytophthora sojae]|uniref:Uncharacterized protein n=1 Tax=Phytophthora sojae (strain P6497) TaxID=1094619 RepID=G4YH22_PHYSP|nr:hypothetical protein PHYSODRAFT_467933 [Phytophthora sojae]EGZ27723.1 hypothetical protein PHYSODRAFT_467933 [Phytophthora sojae]|eukprot:XP_009514998.1 hypothetical protein PHYSODRAFT_467933 [Phytophthora sojae]